MSCSSSDLEEKKNRAEKRGEPENEDYAVENEDYAVSAIVADKRLSHRNMKLLASRNRILQSWPKLVIRRLSLKRQSAQENAEPYQTEVAECWL